MWGSLLIGDDYDVDIEEPDPERAWVLKQLMQHPLWKQGGIVGATFPGSTTSGGGEGRLAGGQPPLEDPEKEREREERLRRIMGRVQNSSDGWFETYMGASAETLVKDLRRQRRVRKDMREDIDHAIEAIRVMKRVEVDETLKQLPWVSDHIQAVQALGLSERDLKSLRKFGEVREVSLRQVCKQWEKANGIITKLSQVGGEWDEEQQNLWVDAIQKRKDARKSWKNTLHQSDALQKREAIWMSKAVNLMEDRGPMDSRAMIRHLSEDDARNTGLSVQKLGSLLKTYGPEYDIIRSGKRWDIEDVTPMLLLKDPWAYAAGFLDADGYITITKRGEPRAGIIATGDRGRWHCEQLHKTLDCGVLQLDLKVHKNSTRSQHRLQFYSKEDLRALLKGIRPHLQMKKNQADAVLELLALRGRDRDIISKRRNELYRVVKWENWKDDPNKKEGLLREWNVDEVEVSSWSQRDPDIIRLVDDAARLTEAV